MNKSETINTINLIQWYYRYLYIWWFLNEIIKKKDLSKNIKDTKIKTWEKTNFSLNSETIKKLLSEIHKNPNKENIFGYFNKISSIKWISSSIKELIDTNKDFKDFFREFLWDQYEDFKEILNFIRNCLNHTISTQIKIKDEDFSTQKKFLLARKKTFLKFNFIYSKHIKTWKWNKKYWFCIKINFKKIKEWDKLFDIIELHNLFMLSEFCYNMCEIYKSRISKIPTKKSK
jgi:hypothetical protein